MAAFASSYIPTLASTVTRSADVASVNTLSPWFNESKGSFLAEWNLPTLSGTQTAFHITDVAENNRIRVFAHLSTLSRATVTAGGSVLANLDVSSVASGVSKFAVAYQSGDQAATRNASAVTTGSGVGYPTGETELRLGRDASSGYLNGHLRRIAYYPRRLTNAELTAISA